MPNNKPLIHFIKMVDIHLSELHEGFGVGHNRTTCNHTTEKQMFYIVRHWKLVTTFWSPILHYLAKQPHFIKKKTESGTLSSCTNSSLKVTC